MTAQPTGFQTGSGQLALALAGVFVRPDTLINAAEHLDSALVSALPGTGLAGRARNRMVSARLGFDGAQFGAGFHEALMKRETCQLACRLVLANAERLRTAMRHLAAAIYQTRLRSAVMKAQRDDLTAQLGEDAVQSGLRQAPVFASSLASLAGQGSDMVARAQAVALRLTQDEDPLLARVLSARLGLGEPSDPLATDQGAAAWRVIAGHL